MWVLGDGWREGGVLLGSNIFLRMPYSAACNSEVINLT